jgi:ribonuclease D
MPPALCITTEQLVHALQQIEHSDFVAIDTEFMRESTYYAGLCLIQIATLEHCVIVDPLAIGELRPLWEFLAARQRLKVLHAGRQDLEVLSQAMAPAGLGIPGPVFDTQIAAALLGHAAQIGYGPLVAERLGHTLPKGLARSDWSRRPLSVQELEYAADDVRYLAPLYINLRDALAAQDRLGWLQEESRELEDERLYRTEPDAAWRRLKGLDRLRPEQRSTAKLLARWRESRAMSSDKPRGWILPDESLREIAERLPVSAADLEQLRSVAPGTIRKRGTEILALVAEGKALAANEPASFIAPRPEPEKLALVTKLMAFVRAQAEQMKVAPELLVTRRDAEHLVFSGRAERLMTGWRREVIGERLVALAETH